jgi:hypothetical protein
MMLRSSPSARVVAGLGLGQPRLHPAQAEAHGSERLAGRVVQLAGDALALGLLRPHDLVQQFAQQLLALLRLGLEQGVVDGEA